MEKEFFEMPRLEVIKWEEEDVLTASGDLDPEGDDIGSWNDDWFGGN